MKKNLTRLLSILLALVLTVGMLPVSALADGWQLSGSLERGESASMAESIGTQAAADNNFYRIIHLDCGRKYFTKDWIIALMKEAKAAGYNQIQLAFGNKGLRFLLDDMSVMTESTTYTSDDVKAAVQAGNKSYYDAGEANELTQAEMDEILAAAETISIDVIPLFNTPFHMEAVITAMERLGISSPYYGSNTACLNLSSDGAVAFVKALMQKYVTYFNNNGCKYFSFGADEYTGGWNNTFYSYAGNIAQMITDAGMTPRVFNDSYRNNSSTYISGVDQVCYWYTGYSGNLYAAASTLSKNGKKLINTNKDYYYVVSKDQLTEWNSSAIQYVFSGPYDETTWINKATQFSNTTYNNWASINSSYNSPQPAGSMFCIWCDNPSHKTETEIAQETRMILRVMAARMQDSYTYSSADVLVDGGFKADGTINTTGGTTPDPDPNPDPDPEPSEPETVNITLKVGETSQTYTHSGTLTAAGGEANIASANVDPLGGTTQVSYKATATASISAYNSYIASNVLDGNTSTYYWSGSAQKEGAYVRVDLGAEVRFDAIQVSSPEHGDVCTNANVQVSSDGETWTTIGTHSGSSSRSVTDTYAVPDTVKSFRYIQVVLTQAKNNWWQLSEIAFGSQENNQFTRAETSGTVEMKTVGTTTVSFTGVTPGTATYKVGNTTYVITVESGVYAYNLSVETGKTVQLTPEPAVPDGAKITYTVTDNAAGITVENGYVTAGASTGTATVTAEVKNDGKLLATYTWNITVAPADLFAKYIYINYFITNHYVLGDLNKETYKKVTAAEAGVNTEAGVDIASLISTTGTDKKTTAPVKFYTATAQEGTNIQTEEGWTNKTKVGTTAQKLRYWDDKWSVWNATDGWKSISGDPTEFNPATDLAAGKYATNGGKAAITAYFVQKTKVTDEVTTYATDWGEDISTSQTNKDISELYNTYALLDFAVKYQSGDRVPATFTNEKTLVYNAVGAVDYRHSDDEGNTRVIKELFVENTPEYEVYMITVTKSTDSLSSAAADLYKQPTVSYGTENEQVIWVDDEADLGEFADTTKYEGYSVGGDPVVPAVYVAKQYGYLITYYVRAKETPDSLKVCYVDKNQGTEFYSYFINVHQNTTFKDSIQLANPWKGNLTNGNVTNVNDKEQWVSADLSTMPAIGAQYRYVDYTCVEVKLSDDKKTLTLYYTFDDSVSFIYDFGLPLTITAKQINDSLTKAGVTLTGLKVFDNEYGTVTVNETDSCFTYTPNTADAQTDTLSVSFTGNIPKKNEDGTYTTQTGTVTYRVSLIPASNVLYEENFLTQVAGDRPRWETDTTQMLTGKAQVTHKAADEARFGYDVAYESITGRNGAWTTSVSKDATVSNALTATFYGNALDVIGSCGADTAMLMFVIRTPGEKAKSVLVDTRYNEGTLEQVPFAHIELGDTDAQHTVLVRAYYAAATTASGNSAVGVMSARASSGSSAERLVLAQMERDLAEDGLTLSDVEFVNAADTLTVRSSASIASYAAVNAETITRDAGTKAAIDAFRVYRSTDNTSYIDSEKGVVYENVLDTIDGEIVTAYREGDSGSSTGVVFTDYESTGGPQNEIYLRKGDSVVFAVDNADATQIQVSLRAVDKATSWNSTAITSNTEMYYVLNKVTDSDGKQVFTITNNGDNLLAIGNVKLPAGTGTNDIIPASELPTDVVLQALRAVSGEEPSEPEPEVFEPDTFDANVSTLRLLRSKLVTIRISVSSDVSYVTVNGVTYWPGRTFSWQRSRTIQFRDTIGRNQSKTYTIIAYDANGVASAPITVNG